MVEKEKETIIEHTIHVQRVLGKLEGNPFLPTLRTDCESVDSLMIQASQHPHSGSTGLFIANQSFDISWVSAERNLRL